VWDLSDAVAVMSTAQLGTELTPADAGAITAFLRTLTGEQPEVDYPVLPPHTESTPQPFVEPLPIQEGAVGH
jgi:cytochrome c peroxidase